MLTPLGRAGKTRLVVEILTAYVRVRYLMRSVDIATAVGRLRTARRTSRWLAPPVEQRLCVRLARAVVRTLGLLPTDNRCLMRSLVLARLLAARGIACRIVIAARTDPDFAAHAWVEHDGVPLLPPLGPEYKRLVEL